MKLNRKFIIALLSLIFVILAACQSSNNENNNNLNEPKDDVSENNNESTDTTNNEDANSENNGSESLSEEQNNEASKSEEKVETVKIKSGEEAVRFLKQQLEEGKNEDISFGTDGILQSDENGSYYTIQLVDVPLRASGKTGNLGYYKVYEDGTYGNLWSHTAQSYNLSEHKDEFLQKLNSIKNELDELQENSNATTTREMEEEAEHIYSTWDNELNEIYSFLQEHLQKEDMDILREQQRAWIVYKEDTAKEESLKYKGGSMESITYLSTLSELTMNKCYELVHMYMN